MTIEERFWAKVVKSDGCWLWTSAKVRGYGVLGRGRRGDGHVLAHRFSWELANGPIPEGLLVCHRCDEPSCVHPDHLFLGTQSDNMADMQAKGRGRQPVLSGEDHPNAKLTHVQVTEIRRRYGSGGVVGQRALAAEYRVSQRAISNVVSGRSWPNG